MRSSHKIMQDAYKITGLTATPLRTLKDDVVEKQRSSWTAMMLGPRPNDSSTTMTMTMTRRQSAALMIIGGSPTPVHPLSVIRRIKQESCAHISVILINDSTPVSPVTNQRSSIGVIGLQQLSPSKGLLLAGCKSIMRKFRKHYCKLKRKVRRKLENKSSPGVGDLGRTVSSVTNMDTGTGMDTTMKRA
ncbi:hypothetical protein RND81_14G090600 [Saponaria officinalis]|uniref:Uncharacterized protein n=1 Tax=Saponaria officinalis TaxID=3572 RepID=A0AAW1GKX2_SAPOF